MVVREIVVGTVAVVFAIGVVVLVVVGHQVLQGEAIVSGDEINRGVGPSAALIKQVAGGGQAARKLWQLTAIATPEGTYCTANAIIPFHPAWRESADLITTDATVPGFCDEFKLAQHGVLTAGEMEAVAFIEAILRSACEDSA